MNRLSALLLLVSALLASAYARADTRVALVIGNSQYASVDALPNPRRDAALVAATLRREGFTVTLVQDATRATMLDALNAFNDQADRADWALVYYAGHGMEVGGTNYLLPTDARLRTDRDVQDETVSLPRVQQAVAHARKLRLIILDACRNNLFVSPMRREFAERAVSRGLARPEPQAGIMVVYAAEAGAVADDGAGDHSPFTAALVKRLEQPGLEVSRLFNVVAGDVLHATANRQRPYVYGSNPGEEEFYFEQPTPVPAPPTSDEQIWSFLKTTKDVVSLRGFLDSLPPTSPLRGEVGAYLTKVNIEQASLVLAMNRAMRPVYAQMLTKAGSTVKPEDPAFDVFVSRIDNAVIAAKPENCNLEDWVTQKCGARSFNTGSSSMEPSIQKGDFVLTLPIDEKRPVRRGDVLVFHVSRPSEAPADWVKRVIGLPGDKIQLINARLYINGQIVPREPIEKVTTTDQFGQEVEVPTYAETLPGGVTHRIIQRDGDNGYYSNTPVYEVPLGDYFTMGDNRDNSTDSRVAPEQGGVGYLSFENFVGRVSLIYVSKDIAQIGRSP